MSANYEAEQFVMPLQKTTAKPTLGQLRAQRDSMIEQLLRIAAHRNQVVRIPRERLEEVACVAICKGSARELFEGFVANEPAMRWVDDMPSRRWKTRLLRLYRLGAHIVMAEIEAAPRAKRASALPPPPRIRPQRSRRHSFLNP